MYDLDSTKGGKLDKKYILSKISQYEIFRHYIGSSFTINKAISSPLRKDDTPSFGIFESSDSTLLFKDLALGESGDCFKFIKLLFNLKSYSDALTKVYVEMVLSNNLPLLQKQYKKEYKISNKNKSIGIKKGIFNTTDYSYWSKYNITKEILIKYNTYKASNVFIENTPIWYSTLGNPIYAYKVFNNYKIYRPLAKKGEKWLGNLTLFDIGGYEQLPEQGETLIITKSIKDIMCLYSLGYNAICPPCETCSIPKEVINNLKKRFNNIYVLYDNDEAGIKAATRTYNTYKLKSFIIPIKSLKKDISDYLEYYGTKEAQKLLKQLINGLKTKEKEKL